MPLYAVFTNERKVNMISDQFAGFVIEAKSKKEAIEKIWPKDSNDNINPRLNKAFKINAVLLNFDSQYGARFV